MFCSSRSVVWERASDEELAEKKQQTECAKLRRRKKKRIWGTNSLRMLDLDLNWIGIGNGGSTKGLRMCKGRSRRISNPLAWGKCHWKTRRQIPDLEH